MHKIARGYEARRRSDCKNRSEECLGGRDVMKLLRKGKKVAVGKAKTRQHTHNRQTYRPTGRQTDRRQTLADRQAGRQTDRPTDRQTDTDSHL